MGVGGEKKTFLGMCVCVCWEGVGLNGSKPAGDTEEPQLRSGSFFSVIISLRVVVALTPGLFMTTCRLFSYCSRPSLYPSY